MERVCFVLQVRADRVTEYRERHREVWPEMRSALSAAGWRNYSLYLRDDGMLVGTLECEDFEAAKAAMDATDVNARWQALVGDLFADTDGHRPDEMMHPLDEVFHLP
jgi:L-rhamnose mutarotase